MIRKKKIKDKKIKNRYLNPDGSFNLIDEFVGIDYMPYERKKKRKTKVK